jgi:hypothetical protein
MDWLPEDADFLTVVGTLLGAGTALLGLVVGLRQRPGPTRAGRKTVETTAEPEPDPDDFRRIVLGWLGFPAQGHLAAAPDVLGRLCHRPGTSPTGTPPRAWCPRWAAARTTRRIPWSGCAARSPSPPRPGNGTC